MRANEWRQKIRLQDHPRMSPHGWELFCPLQCSRGPLDLLLEFLHPKMHLSSGAGQLGLLVSLACSGLLIFAGAIKASGATDPELKLG